MKAKNQGDGPAVTFALRMRKLEAYNMEINLPDKPNRTMRRGMAKLAKTQQLHTIGRPK